jgi:hypothetical protein
MTVPTNGKLTVDFQLTADVNISSAVAKRKVNAFIATHIGNLLLAGEPALTFTERIVWRVPVDLTQPHIGRLGKVGEVDVDVATGEIILDAYIQSQIEANAQRLIASTSL